jgi:hypothetical protein
MKKAETVVVATADPRVWCDTCRVRIAPTEERIARDEQYYHLRCRPKPHRATDKLLAHH